MEELKHGDITLSYLDVVKSLREKYPGIEEVGELLLTIGETRLFMTPEQAVDLAMELRRAVVKVKPIALRARKRFTAEK